MQGKNAGVGQVHINKAKHHTHLVYPSDTFLSLSLFLSFVPLSSLSLFLSLSLSLVTFLSLRFCCYLRILSLVSNAP
jgi:hypothetical protein